MRVFQTFCARCAGAVLAVCLMGKGGLIHAQSSAVSGSGAGSATANVDAPRGGASLDRAQAAWGRGDFDVAEAQFKDAILLGGLARKDVLKAHIYLGAARAVLGKRTGAEDAFRIAASLDPSFKVPPEAGKKAAGLAEAARKHRFQPPTLRAEAPPGVPAGLPFRIEASLVSPAARTPAAGALVVLRIGLQVNDGGTSSYKSEQAAGNRVAFDVPATIATGGANLSVRVSGLDGRGNELATSDLRVHVESENPAPTPLAPVAIAPPPPEKPPRTTVADARFSALSPADPHAGSERSTSKGGFWSSPWPYIIGGAVLAGAGTGAYFALRSSDQVTVTPVQVQAIR